MTLTIHVTQDDIDHGVAADCQHCPVARAVQRAMGDDNIIVNGELVFKSYSNLTMQYNLPLRVSNWITRFDTAKGIRFRPLTFTLTIPDADPVAVRLREVAP